MFRFPISSCVPIGFDNAQMLDREKPQFQSPVTAFQSKLVHEMNVESNEPAAHRSRHREDSVLTSHAIHDSGDTGVMGLGILGETDGRPVSQCAMNVLAAKMWLNRNISYADMSTLLSGIDSKLPGN